jgi:23S rRNA pseudouridine955/2504/2580 synthase
VNRLDRNTKGLIIAAKNTSAARILSAKIKTHEVEKYYIAKIHGIIDPKNGVLTDYLTKSSKDNIVTITKAPFSTASQQIITEYHTISHNNIDSYVEILLRTGKTHQIRAHMNFINHPLYGEKKYTSAKFKDKEKYQNLCSYKITFN